MIFQKVMILYEFVKVTFQKICVFSLGEPRGTGCKSGRLQRVQYHIGIRTLNARRMFREQSEERVKNAAPIATVWQSNGLSVGSLDMLDRLLATSY